MHHEFDGLATTKKIVYILNFKSWSKIQIGWQTRSNNQNQGMTWSWEHIFKWPILLSTTVAVALYWIEDKAARWMELLNWNPFMLRTTKTALFFCWWTNIGMQTQRFCEINWFGKGTNILFEMWMMATNNFCFTLRAADVALFFASSSNKF